MKCAKYPKVTLSEVVLSFLQDERVKWGEGKRTAGEEGIWFGMDD
jgi:hypothetical protein